jgi:uncharacterized protein YkwD
MSTRETINFLCECLPHVDHLRIIKYVRENPNKSIDRLYDIISSENPSLIEPITNIDREINTVSNNEKEILTEGSMLENAIDASNDENSEPEIHVSDNPPLMVELDHMLALQLEQEENDKNKSMNNVLAELNKARQKRSLTDPTRSRKSSLTSSSESSKPISSLLADLHEQRLRRACQQPTPRQKSPQPKRKSMVSELEAARKKLKQKWRDTTPTARTMTLSDLEKRENLTKESKLGNWGDDEGHSKPLRGVQTLDTLLYDEERIGREALQLTNSFREKNNLPPLKWSQALCKIGRVHSKDMAEGRVPFGHSGFEKRVASYPMPTSSAAENVAWNAGTSDIAVTAVNGWINSPGHRKNLLSRHNYCGIGVFRSANNRFYLTQLFALS